MNDGPLRDFRRPAAWLLLWIVLIKLTLIICLVPLPPSTVPIDNLDKLQHAAGYALLAAYAMMLFSGCRAQWIALVGLMALGVLIEALQALLPWRSAEWMDVLANGVGVLLGGAITLTPAARWLLRLDAAVARQPRR